jgi:alginate O-acetyltransferase complex protein AlgI
MGLGGLWHGASWNFVIWGLYHGVLLMVHRAWRQWRGPGRQNAAGSFVAVTFTFLLVTIGWVPFRAPDFATTWKILGDLVAGAVNIGPVIPTEFLVLSGAMFFWLAIDRDRRLQTWLSQGSGVLGTIKVSSALAVALLVMMLFSRTDIAVPFIYFQF